MTESSQPAAQEASGPPDAWQHPSANALGSPEAIRNVTDAVVLGTMAQRIVEALGKRPAPERELLMNTIGVVDYLAGRDVTPAVERVVLLRLEAVSTANARRCAHAFHAVADWTPTDWACALAGETGELCNLIKKRRRGEAIPDQAIADEIADVFLYLDLLATRLGINLAQAIIHKFNAVSVKVGSEERL